MYTAYLPVSMFSVDVYGPLVGGVHLQGDGLQAYGTGLVLDLPHELGPDARVPVLQGDGYAETSDVCRPVTAEGDSDLSHDLASDLGDDSAAVSPLQGLDPSHEAGTLTKPGHSATGVNVDVHFDELVNDLDCVIKIGCSGFTEYDFVPVPSCELSHLCSLPIPEFFRDHDWGHT